eukprot:1148959-Rhodomonas_salina.1
MSSHYICSAILSTNPRALSLPGVASGARRGVQAAAAQGVADRGCATALAGSYGAWVSQRYPPTHSCMPANAVSLRVAACYATRSACEDLHTHARAAAHSTMPCDRLDGTACGDAAAGTDTAVVRVPAAPRYKAGVPREPARARHVLPVAVAAGAAAAALELGAARLGPRGWRRRRGG